MPRQSFDCPFVRISQFFFYFLQSQNTIKIVNLSINHELFDDALDQDHALERRRKSSSPATLEISGLLYSTISLGVENPNFQW